MSRYTGPLCRMCRTEQKKLMLKGARCLSDKCPINRKRPAPGKDPKGRTGKRSEYGTQLREKQKIKRMYGTSLCDWKCCNEQCLDKNICQNSSLANSKTIDVSADEI